MATPSRVTGVQAELRTFLFLHTFYQFKYQIRYLVLVYTHNFIHQRMADTKYT